MKLLFIGLIFIWSLFIHPRSVHAFIILPAVILIPIAQIVAVILGGFSLPAMGLGVLWSKLTGKSLPRGILFGISFLGITAVMVIILLKLINPDRPLF